MENMDLNENFFKAFAVDSCFVLNAINLRRALHYDTTLHQLLKNHENIYEYYKVNKLPYPNILKTNFFSATSIKHTDDGYKKDFWRLHYFYYIVGYCKSRNIELCVTPTVYNELTFNRNKPETNYKDYRVVESKEYKALFKQLIVDNEDLEEFITEREALAITYLQYNIMKPSLDTKTGLPTPSADARVMAESTILGLSLITSDSDYITEGKEFDVERAKKIRETNEQCGYNFKGCNGKTIFDEWTPMAMADGYFYNRLINNKQPLVFALNPNVVNNQNTLQYQPPLFEV